MLMILETKEEFEQRTQKAVDDAITLFDTTHAPINRFLNNIGQCEWVRQAQRNLEVDPEGQSYSRGIIDGVNSLLEEFDENFYTYVHLSYERVKALGQLRNQLLYRQFSLEE